MIHHLNTSTFHYLVPQNNQKKNGKWNHFLSNLVLKGLSTSSLYFTKLVRHCKCLLIPRPLCVSKFQSLDMCYTLTVSHSPPNLITLKPWFSSGCRGGAGRKHYFYFRLRPCYKPMHLHSPFIGEGLPIYCGGSRVVKRKKMRRNRRTDIIINDATFYWKRKWRQE